MSELNAATLSDTPSKKRKRPVAITIVGTVMLLGALIAIVAGALIVYSHGVLTPKDLNEILAADPEHLLFTDEGDILVAGSLALISGIIELIIAIGFFRLARWAWVAAMTWVAFDVLLELSHVDNGTMDPFSLAFSILIIFLLNQGEVRRIYGIVKHPDESATQSSFPAVDES